MSAREYWKIEQPDEDHNIKYDCHHRDMYFSKENMITFAEAYHKHKTEGKVVVDEEIWDDLLDSTSGIHRKSGF